MTTMSQVNADYGSARDAVYDQMDTLLKDTTTAAGDRSAELLDAQGDLSISDGVQNVLAKGYNRWQQTGQ
jgi:hypothetical protein